MPVLQKEFILEQVLDVAHLPVLLGGDGIAAAQLMAEKLVETFQTRRKILYLGLNDYHDIAAHLAREMHKGLIMKRPPLPAVLLDGEKAKEKTDYENILLQQVEKNGEKGDVLFLLNGGKNSCLDTLLTKAETMNLGVLLFSGYPKPKKIPSPYFFYIPSANRARVEEVFLIMGHIICTLVESILFSDGDGI